MIGSEHAHPRVHRATVARMDEEWALAELRAFVAMTERVPLPGSPGMIGPTRFRTIGESGALVQAAQTVEKILERVVPDWRHSAPENSRDRWFQRREASQRAIAEIQRGAEVAEKLGDNSPALKASGLHPWVWDGARSLWQSGHRREAVRAASVFVNAEVQSRLGRRDIGETTLFQQAYSNDVPQLGQPRLRPAGDDGGKTSQSVRRGVMALAEGLFAAVRNPATHDPLSELGEQEALELLAAWSVLARLVEASTMERSGGVPA